MDTDTQPTADIPLMQRVYDRIWLLAAAAILFFALSYVAWGLMDLAAIPGG